MIIIHNQLDKKSCNEEKIDICHANNLDEVLGKGKFENCENIIKKSFVKSVKKYL